MKYAAAANFDTLKLQDLLTVPNVSIESGINPAAVICTDFWDLTIIILNALTAPLLHLMCRQAKYAEFDTASD